MIALCSFESAHEFRGTDVYARNLIYGLSKVEKTTAYVVFTNCPEVYQYLKKTPNFKIHAVNLPLESIHSVNTTTSNRISPDLLWLQSDLYRLIQQYDFQIVHPLGYYGPQFRRPDCKARFIITAHGMEHEVTPQMFRPQMVRFLQKSVPNSIEVADHVIAVSHSVKEDVQRIYHTPAEKLSVVHHGVSEVFMQSSLPMGWDAPYILHVGSGENRKNFITVLKGFHFYREKNPLSPLRLVVVGRGFEKFYDIVKDWNLSDTVIFCGFIAQNQRLVQLYQNAFVFTCLSTYEGFGLIVAEALVSCVPMIVSDIPVFTEIVQDAGIRIDPEDADAFADWVERLQSDTTLYKMLKRRLYERRTMFSIEKMAQDTKMIYQQCTGLNRERII